MDFKEYQKLAHRTSMNPMVGGINYVYPTLGLAGEAGEFSNKVKKIFRDDKGVLTDARKEDIKHELGDMLWYIAEICTCMDIDFNEIAEAKIKMLASRLERKKITGSGDNR
jgi:NTP pyrophosphatase (non-canonical NTP hydrolase)